MLFRSNDTATTEIYTVSELFPYTTLFRSKIRSPLINFLMWGLQSRLAGRWRQADYTADATSIRTLSTPSATSVGPSWAAIS